MVYLFQTITITIYTLRLLTPSLPITYDCTIQPELSIHKQYEIAQ